MDTEYKIEIEEKLPDRAGKHWVTHNRAPYVYRNKDQCLQDLKAYRMLSTYKGTEFRALAIQTEVIR